MAWTCHAEGAPCVPNCTGKVCGNNGCGGSCGTCGVGETCTAGACVKDPCVPNCTGKTCGDNGCGGSCGTCLANETCQAGVCKKNAITEQTVAFQFTGQLSWAGKTKVVASWATQAFTKALDADPDGIVRVFVEATSVSASPLNGGFYSDDPFKVVQVWNSPYPPACDGYADTEQHVIKWEASGPPNWPKGYWVLLFCP